MLKTMVGFNRCLLAMPLPWVVWVMALAAVNLIGPLFFLGRPEGPVVLAVFLLSAGCLMLLYGRQGFTRLLGAGHFLWLGLVPWLWGRLELAEPGSAFAAWLVAVMAVNAISLIIDAVDLVRYLRGERAPTVEL